MKIYRYTYIKKELKITEYECTKTFNGDYLITEDCKKHYGKRIKNEKLDKMIDGANYIMWTLKNDKDTFNHFKNLILERKNYIAKSFYKNYLLLNDEINKIDSWN